MTSKNEMLSDVGGSWGLASVLDTLSLFFLLKKIGFAPWPDIMLSQTLIYFIDKKSSFWLWRQTAKPFFDDSIALFES